jgi:hypothetical protein
MPATNEDDRYYRALCICGAELPFDDETTELSCPTCQAKIAISYVAHQDSTRATIENAGTEFLKGVFSVEFAPDQWTARRQQKEFESFKEFAKAVYADHLSPRAKVLDANREVYFVFFYANTNRIKLGPHDITTEDGFAEYLFRCCTLQTAEVVFSLGIGKPICSAVFRVVINDSDPYYVLRYSTMLMDRLKGEEIPRLCRGGSSSLTFTGVHPRNSNGEPTKAHAKEKLDGPIGKSKPLGMGVQIPRGIYPEMPPQGAV